MSELYTKYATEQYVDDNLNIGLDTKADAEHNHDSSYDVKGAANTALNSAKEYVDEAVSSLDTIIATDENSDGNIVLRPYIPEEDFIQVDKTLTIEGAAADAKAVGDRIKNLTASGDAPVLDAVLDANGIMTYNNSPAFDEWLTEDEAAGMFAPNGLVSLKSYPIASEDELNSVFDQRLSLMASHSHEYFITNSSVSALLGGSRTLWHLYKYTADYATAEAIYYSTQGCCKLTKLKYSGEWQPLEWDNPPMVLGVEYRTTERYQGKPVYAKSIQFTCQSANTIEFSTGIESISSWHKKIVRFGGTVYNPNSQYAFQIPSKYCTVRIGTTGCVLDSDGNLTMTGHVANIDIYYTK